jgi:general secretion pathway protein A
LFCVQEIITKTEDTDVYKTYFGLKENPFTINTDPRYLYSTQPTKDALSRLTHGIEARKGFILLSGEVGTGKTTLLHKLLESLHEQRVATAFVFNPQLNSAQFFDYMMADFGISCKLRMKSRVLFRLHQWLLDRYQAGEQSVLVVDEAQNLSLQTLEEIRLLTNLETSTDKLLQIVLAGQPELEEKLNRRELRQLRQRVAIRAKTLPLTPEETCGYILERLRIAGSNGEEIFTPLAIEAVHQHAHGIPRVTNLICEQALIRAFIKQQQPVPAEIVEDVTRDFSLDEGDLLAQPPPPQRPSNNGRVRRHAERSRARRSSKTAGQGRAEQPVQQPPVGITQIKLPLFVYGYAPDGTPFYEQAQTIATTDHGGLISMKTAVQPGQRLLLTNKENECSQECVVEFLGASLARGVDVAFEFPAPTPQFWGAREIGNNLARENEEACA